MAHNVPAVFHTLNNSLTRKELKHFALFGATFRDNYNRPGGKTGQGKRKPIERLMELASPVAQPAFLLEAV
jgi:hypothetical protein